MPTISMFYGIIIRMYFGPGEHPPPHFHAVYAEHEMLVNIENRQGMERQTAAKTNSVDAGLGGLAQRRADGQLATRNGR